MRKRGQRLAEPCPVHVYTCKQILVQIKTHNLEKITDALIHKHCLTNSVIKKPNKWTHRVCDSMHRSGPRSSQTQSHLGEGRRPQSHPYLSGDWKLMPAGGGEAFFFLLETGLLKHCSAQEMTLHRQLPGAPGGFQSHSSCHCLLRTCTRSKELKFQHKRGGTHKAPLPAKDFWQLKPADGGKPVFLSEIGPGWASIWPYR